MGQELINQNIKDIVESGEMIDSKSIEDIMIYLPLGEALDLKDTYNTTSRDKSKLIVLAGPSECGKTTLITTIYQLFHKGPIYEFYFAGSQTIKAFEQRSYYTRTNSGMSEPNTTRTRVGTLDSFLHLKLWDNKNNLKHTFLLADLSGEDFKNARANVEIMKEDFSIIKQADFLVVIIDGDSITQKDKRHSAVQTTQELLRTMNDSGILKKDTEICFVISKDDLVRTRCNSDSSLQNFVDAIPNKLKLLCEDIKIQNEIQFYKIAAMPTDTDVALMGDGVNELVREWTKESVINESSIYIEQKELKSEFNKLYKKVLGGQNYE